MKDAYIVTEYMILSIRLQISMPTFADLRLHPNKPLSFLDGGWTGDGPVQAILTFGNGSDDVE